MQVGNQYSSENAIQGLKTRFFLLHRLSAEPLSEFTESKAPFQIKVHQATLLLSRIHKSPVHLALAILLHKGIEKVILEIF